MPRGSRRGRTHFGKLHSASLTVRKDIEDWLEDERQGNQVRYRAEYGDRSVSSLGPFAQRYILNALLAWEEQNPTVRLSPAAYRRLKQKYLNAKAKGRTETFEEYLNDLLSDI